MSALFSETGLVISVTNSEQLAWPYWSDPIVRTTLLVPMCNTRCIGAPLCLGDDTCCCRFEHGKQPRTPPTLTKAIDDAVLPRIRKPK